MPDETATATTEPTADTAASTAHAPAGGGAPGHEDPEPDKLPDLSEGSDNEKWVKYLQQTLNYYYQMQVVPESGTFDSQTAHVVAHYRDQAPDLHGGSHVDKDMWVMLGVEDTHAAWEERQRNRAHGGAGGGAGAGGHGAGQHGAGGHGGHGEHGAGGHGASFEPRHHAVNMVPASSQSSGWAASMAIVLNFKGGSHTAESVCQHGHIDPQEFKSAREVSSIGTELGLQPIYCDGTTAAGWAQALATGPLWTPNPANDSNVIVVAGVDGSGENTTVHVLDPAENYDDWMAFGEFHQRYAFGDSCELLG
jgi:Papain-like cysteine protease AvrRpt2